MSSKKDETRRAAADRMPDCRDAWRAGSFNCHPGRFTSRTRESEGTPDGEFVLLFHRRAARRAPTAMAAMMPFAALALGSSLITVAADGVPTLNIQPSCKAAGIEGVSIGRTTDSCLNDEHSAREDLVKTWSSYSAADKSHCLSMVSTGGSPSYVELISCLEMSRDAKRIATGQSLGPVTPAAPAAAPAAPARKR
jgi:hypothetical protein